MRVAVAAAAATVRSVWVHSNCAIYSSEVYDDGQGSMDKMVCKAVARSQFSRCTACMKFGATLGCLNMSCKANFHFTCANQKYHLGPPAEDFYCYACRPDVHWLQCDACDEWRQVTRDERESNSKMGASWACDGRFECLAKRRSKRLRRPGVEG